jgi:hypothetical protein
MKIPATTSKQEDKRHENETKVLLGDGIQIEANDANELLQRIETRDPGPSTE